MTVIVEKYAEEDLHHFTSLNVHWVKKYFTLEPSDEEMLYHPKENILNKGGHIYFAKTGGNIAGTFAFLPVEENVFELSKMAVDEAYHGKKIGNKMLAFCLEEARRLGAKKVILYSNTILHPAIHLYKKFGFQEVPLDASDYERSNIKMEINL